MKSIMALVHFKLHVLQQFTSGSLEENNSAGSVEQCKMVASVFLKHYSEG